ncbi:MAG: hypothetical protein QXO46_08270 [Nitrososphaerota archaeon]
MRIKRVLGREFDEKGIGVGTKNFWEDLEYEHLYVVTDDGYIYYENTAEDPIGQLRYTEDFDCLEGEEYSI